MKNKVGITRRPNVPTLTLLVADPDIRVLREMRQMLEPMQPHWTLFFCDDIEDAIRMLEEQTIDVVIADGQLPGIKDRHLLDYVRVRSPRTVRFVMAREADHDSLAETLVIAHQYLPKPCRLQLIMEALQRIDTTQQGAENPVLEQLVRGIGMLPTLPSTYTELMQLFQNPEVSIKEVTARIERDFAISVEVLRLVNSGYFSLRQYVTDLQQAVMLLGINTVRSLVQTVALFSAIEDEKARSMRQEMYMHVVQVNQHARVIGRVLNVDSTTQDHISLAALLHDIGKLIFSSYLSQDYFPTISLAKATRLPLHQVERQIFGVTHAELGAYLLGLWGFSDNILTAVGFHHNPSRRQGPHNPVLTAVHLADVLYHQQREAESSFSLQADRNYIDHLPQRDQLLALCNSPQSMAA
jgi:HD-like signal output (HDOD) protein/CheY-like chemotaxis protein